MKHTTRTEIHSQGTSSGRPGRHETHVKCSRGKGIISGPDHNAWSKWEDGEIIDLKRGVVAVRSGQERD